ncbi:hypothetical protein AXG93_949s1030 [Marchantia polymorpha subsp. ruderalis]|uniref:Uncharacterized protein n=1 Tax=Marchantia polymorpha subsp. ruderalis TaxID=1480154 RepID=A0A176VZU2_MARPO|nr:hypothetical protein AXG93_949s1030 [Marchantia polymorpha subsp. ruderalis]
MQMAAMPVKYRNTRVQSSMAQMFSSIYKILRLAFVCSFLLLFVLVILIYSFNHALIPNHGAGRNGTMHSPLQTLLTKEQTMQEELRESDSEMLKRINDRSTLEVKILVIAETVAPYEDREKLETYISKQLESSDVVSKVQASALLSMVNLAPMEASLSREETGLMGSLRNSALLALIKRDRNNVHFMMVGVRAEPRLGWRRISAKERNSWNSVLSRAIMNKVRMEAQNYLWQRTMDDVQDVVKLDVRDELAWQSLLPDSVEPADK